MSECDEVFHLAILFILLRLRAAKQGSAHSPSVVEFRDLPFSTKRAICLSFRETYMAQFWQFDIHFPILWILKLKYSTFVLSVWYID